MGDRRRGQGQWAGGIDHFDITGQSSIARSGGLPRPTATEGGTGLAGGSGSPDRNAASSKEGC